MVGVRTAFTCALHVKHSPLQEPQHYNTMPWHGTHTPRVHLGLRNIYICVCVVVVGGVIHERMTYVLQVRKHVRIICESMYDTPIYTLSTFNFQYESNSVYGIIIYENILMQYIYTTSYNIYLCIRSHGYSFHVAFLMPEYMPNTFAKDVENTYFYQYYVIVICQVVRRKKTCFYFA